MKKLLLGLLVVLSIGFISCEKEELENTVDGDVYKVQLIFRKSSISSGYVSNPSTRPTSEWVFSTNGDILELGSDYVIFTLNDMEHITLTSKVSVNVNSYSGQYFSIQPYNLDDNVSVGSETKLNLKVTANSSANFINKH